MNDKARRLIKILALIFVGTYFLFKSLSVAKSFLAPLSIAILLAMLMVPISNWMEKKGLNRGLASFISVLMIISFFAGLFFVISAQVKSVAEDWPQMQKQLKPKIEQLQAYIEERTGFTKAQQQKQIEKRLPTGQASSGEEQSGQKKSGEQKERASGGSQSSSSTSLGIGSALMSFFSFLGTSLLTFVYIFFFLLYRTKFHKSILKFVPDSRKEKAKSAIKNSVGIAQKYLFGKFILIIMLGVFYAIGLSVSGVQHAVLISLLAAVLSLVPYIGNIIGFGLAVALGLFSGGGSGALIGVTVTFSIAQFVESYILEPYIVGDKVDIHPVHTILAVVAGGALWGVIGMIIAIPIVGIVKVICDHVPILHPVGYFLGVEKKPDDNGNFFSKMYEKFKR